MKTIKQIYHIKAPVEKVWQALVDPEIIDKWGGGPSEMNDKKGEKFSLWDGQIYGTNREVVKEKKLVQDWYDGKGMEPTLCTFILTKTGDETKIKLLHEKVPDEKFKDFLPGSPARV